MADFVRYGIGPLLAHEEIDAQTFERVRNDVYLRDDEDKVYRSEKRRPDVEVFYRDDCVVIFDRTQMVEEEDWASVGPKCIVIASDNRKKINDLAKKLDLPEVPEGSRIRSFEYVKPAEK